MPDADWNGSASFSYTATDNGGATSASATASITVSAVNDAPEGGDVTDPTWDATDGRYELNKAIVDLHDWLELRRQVLPGKTP